MSEATRKCHHVIIILNEFMAHNEQTFAIKWLPPQGRGAIVPKIKPVDLK